MLKEHASKFGRRIWSHTLFKWEHQGRNG